MKSIIYLSFLLTVWSGNLLYAQASDDSNVTHYNTQGAIRKSNSTTLLRRPTITRLKTTSFYDPKLAAADESKNTFFRQPYEVPALNKIDQANLKKTESKVFKHNSETTPDLSNITKLPEKPGEVAIDNGKVIFRAEDRTCLVTEIEMKGELRDHNGKVFRGNDIRDNLDRFEDVEETVHASLFEVFSRSGYTPSKLLLNFNKQSGFQFDLHVFQSSAPESKAIIINELELRTEIFLHRPVRI